MKLAMFERYGNGIRGFCTTRADICKPRGHAFCTFEICPPAIEDGHNDKNRNEKIRSSVIENQTVSLQIREWMFFGRHLKALPVEKQKTTVQTTNPWKILNIFRSSRYSSMCREEASRRGLGRFNLLLFYLPHSGKRESTPFSVISQEQNFRSWRNFCCCVWYLRTRHMSDLILFFS